MKNSKKIVCMFLSLFLVLTCFSAVGAKEKSYDGTVKKIYIKNNKTYYKGEKIKLKADVVGIDSADTPDDECEPVFVYGGLTSKKLSSKLFISSSIYSSIGSLVPLKGAYTYNTTLDTKKAKIGTNYVFVVITMGSIDAEEEMSVKQVKVNIAKLKAPTKLKAKAGKRKVTLSFKKATGGKKYEIYRSTKKTAGSYKKIKSTASNKFIDKNLKKGKRYYYKVRTVRGSVKSSFTKPVRTPKVK